jgi:hypothetical protein
MENRDGEEGYEAPSVDEGGHSHAKDARAREDKDDCDCAQTEAQRGSYASEGDGAWCDAGDIAKEEKEIRRLHTKQSLITTRFTPIFMTRHFPTFATISAISRLSRCKKE